MKTPALSAPSDRRLVSRAFTMADLLVMVALCALLASLVAVRLNVTKRRMHLGRCTVNLKEINRAMLVFAADNSQTLPSAVPGNPGNLWWWYKELVKGYTGLNSPSSPDDTVFACPDDRGYSDPIPFCRSPRFDYGSYVFNGVTLPAMPNIAGWPVPAIKRPHRTLLVMEWTAHAPLSWHHSKTGRKNTPFYNDAESVLGFVDGHVSFSKVYYDGYNAAYTQDPIVGYEYQYSGN